MAVPNDLHASSMGSAHRVGGHSTPTIDLDAFLAKSRPYLKTIAEAEMPANLRAKLDASDVVQETLLRAYRQYKQFTGSSDAEFAAWLREILRNQIIDLTRHHARQMRNAQREQALSDAVVSTGSKTPSDAVRRAEVVERLQIAIRELPEQYRTVILLRQEEDLTFEQIGERMNRTSDAARMLWARAILQLAKMVKRDQ